MAGCDVIISSSISEGFPLVLCEALALGKPVIATRCTGNQDVLQDGRFGLLVDNTEEGLTEGMRRVLSDPELYADLKRKARAGTDSLEYDTIITQIQDLLNE